jgi:hypothetical protein
MVSVMQLVTSQLAIMTEAIATMNVPLAVHQVGQETASVMKLVTSKLANSTKAIAAQRKHQRQPPLQLRQQPRRQLQVRQPLQQRRKDQPQILIVQISTKSQNAKRKWVYATGSQDLAVASWTR